MLMHKSRSNEPIRTVAVIGEESMAGAAIATRWADRYEIVGVSTEEMDAITSDGGKIDLHADVVVYCGPASTPSWDAAASAGLNRDAVMAAASIAKLARGRLIMISSDAVFTGPYMFHGESSQSRCQSVEAGIISQIEAAVQKADPLALIVRTHVFGPSVSGRGLVEQILGGERIVVGGGGHASPILGRDFADQLERAMVSDLRGPLHIAGGERVSPRGFAERLREAFDLPRIDQEMIVGEHASGFAAGDRALACRTARGKMGLAMPLLSEGFARLRTQLESTETTRVRSAA